MATSYPRFKTDTKKYLLKRYKDRAFNEHIDLMEDTM